MRTHLILFHALLNVLLSSSSLAQATFELNNRNLPLGIDAPVFDAQGIPLQGTNYLAELYGGRTPDTLAPAFHQIRSERVAVPFRILGYFSTAFVEIPSVAPGFFAWLQVRAWDARLGSTYEEVAIRGLGGYGESPLFYAQGAGFSVNGTLPFPLVGLKSFSLRPARAVLFRAITRQKDQVVLEWDPGFKSYQLEQTSTLVQPWENLGEPTTNLTATVKLEGPARFFRVIGFLY